jgi:acetyl/propionyl-CoA carboxylase alpha subunit
VVEESPSVAVTPLLRRRLGEAAVAIARAAGYRNAGTSEFLVDGRGDDARFYFLEMNARLQVEHPVTETVTGVDLVQAQIRVAAGEPLPWTQEALGQRGHAIELRLYAEDPRHDFLPQAGTLLLYREPSMPGVRVDSGVTEGTSVPVHYDPLLAKLIVSGESREAARRRALEALRHFPMLGVVTNGAFLNEVLQHPRFVAGDFDTHFLDREHGALVASLSEEPPAIVRALAEHPGVRGSEGPKVRGSEGLSSVARSAKEDPTVRDPWDRLRMPGSPGPGVTS